jgi:hypothetical protein
MQPLLRQPTGFKKLIAHSNKLTLPEQIRFKYDSYRNNVTSTSKGNITTGTGMHATGLRHQLPQEKFPLNKGFLKIFQNF